MVFEGFPPEVEEENPADNERGPLDLRTCPCVEGDKRRHARGNRQDAVVCEILESPAHTSIGYHRCDRDGRGPSQYLAEDRPAEPIPRRSCVICGATQTHWGSMSMQQCEQARQERRGEMQTLFAAGEFLQSLE